MGIRTGCVCVCVCVCVSAGTAHTPRDAMAGPKATLLRAYGWWAGELFMRPWHRDRLRVGPESQSRRTHPHHTHPPTPLDGPLGARVCHLRFRCQRGG